MREGDIVGGRWRLSGRLDAPRGLSRWAALDLTTGAEVEVLALRDEVAALDEVRREFRRVHAAIATVDHPAVWGPVESVRHERRDVVIRPRVHHTVDLLEQLAPDAVALLGARLLDAMQAAEPALRGALLPSDIAMTDDGQVWLAPTGRPLTPVDRAANAAISDDPGPLRAAFGLAHVLARLATGGPLGAAPDTGDAGLDDALDALLTPTRRHEAAALLAARAEGSVRPRARPMERAAAPIASGREDRADVVPVVIPASALAALSPAERSAAAGWAGVGQAEVDAHATSGRPLVVAHAPSVRAARAKASSIREQSGLPVTVEAGSTWPVWGAAALAGGTGMLLALVSVFAFLLGAGAVIAGAAGLAALTAGALSAILITGLASRGAPPAARVRHAAASELVRARMASLRRTLAELDLPDAVAVDLRGRLREIERMADALDAAGVDHALATVDVDALAARAAALPDGPERAELQRSVERYQRAAAARSERDARVAALDAALDDVGATLAEVTAQSLDLEHR